MTEATNSTPEAEAVAYVSRYGGMCRDCADQDGICPSSGLPCETTARHKAIAHVIGALDYGKAHGFLSTLPQAGEPSPAQGAATFTVDDLAQEIRRVDGNHDIGAGALAEALIPFIATKIACYLSLEAAPTQQPDAGALREAVARLERTMARRHPLSIDTAIHNADLRLFLAALTGTQQAKGEG